MTNPKKILLTHTLTHKRKDLAATRHHIAPPSSPETYMNTGEPPPEIGWGCMYITTAAPPHPLPPTPAVFIFTASVSMRSTLSHLGRPYMPTPWSMPTP